MDRERPWCVVRGLGVNYALTFGCDDTETFLGLVRSLKSRVDWRARRFDPNEKAWHVARPAGRDLWGWVLAHVEPGQRRFVGVDPDELRGVSGPRPRASPPPPPPPPPRPGGRDDPYATLWLRPGAPPELVRAAYKALVFKHHPDKGGDTATMQAINAAYERLAKGAA